MQKKTIRFLITIVVIALVAYNSVYFSKLDEIRASSSAAKFNPVLYANTFWSKKLGPRIGKAIEIGELVTLLKKDPEPAFTQYSHALGIGNIRYFLVKGEGEIISVNDNDLSIKIHSDFSQPAVKIATEYIFGNAVRDASGLIDINEFENTMDFNNVSAEINKIIRAQVLPALKKNARKGAVIQFTGAIQLNKEHLKTESITVIPVQVNIKG